MRHRLPYLLQILVLFMGFSLCLNAQRQYSPQSVLSTGQWYQIAVRESGIYKMDRAFFAQLGISAASLPSASLRVFGSNGQMLPEANFSQPQHDLQEIALQVEDGGDGVINGNDYVLFYANGPDQWITDSLQRTFRHQAHLYSIYNYYYISIQGAGKRVGMQSAQPSATQVISDFDGRYFHELDTINFLSGGKEWYGEEFAEAPNKTVLRQFRLDLPNILPAPGKIRLSFVARSVGNASVLQIHKGNNPIGQLSIPPTGAGQYDAFAREAGTEINFNDVSGDLRLQFVPGSFNAQGWLNYFEYFCKQSLRFTQGRQLDFRNWASLQHASVNYKIADASADMRVWDITQNEMPVQMILTNVSDGRQFTQLSDRMREYIAFQPSSAFTPIAKGVVANQNLHQLQNADYIIITHESLKVQADRLAQLHSQTQQLNVQVITIRQIYHEFSGGKTDPVAIRDFVKMLYDRSANSPAQRPKYLLLFGDASYDMKDRLQVNTDLIPTWQNNFSLEVLSSYGTDDFFGYLEDDEDINSGTVQNDLDIGIGRVPAKTIQEAKFFVDKVESYLSAASMGAWRTQLSLIADDEDNNEHISAAEQIGQTIATQLPEMDIEKTYLDAFPQETAAGGNRYPLVNQTISNQILAGKLIWNYTGHGGPRRLADEAILDQTLLESWQNEFRLPLMITATCDFAPFDKPQITSLGEQLLLQAKHGAIALMTTTRIVFSGSNREMNTNYIRFALERQADGKFRTLGDAVRDAKNFTMQQSTDVANVQKFALLGDPALRLAFPAHKLNITSVNGAPITNNDTLKATQKIELAGEVRDQHNNFLSDFNGTAFCTVFDKENMQQTLGNDAGASPITSFSSRNHVLFKGKATVTNGRFMLSFRVPKDIRYEPGRGKVSLYAQSADLDAMGVESGLWVGGTAADMSNDKEGPDIRIFLNDTRFISGGTTHGQPILLLELSDSSGINTMGTGIGHDLTVMLNDDPDQLYILNKYYEAEADNYQKGSLRFQLPRLPGGRHTLKVKAWDTMNNSSEAVLDFVVAVEEELVLTRVLNYPNPFTSKTSFWFEHNQPGQDLRVRLQIFTISGKLIKSKNQTINTSGFRSMELEWDGRDEFGDKVARGVYLYKLIVTLPGKKSKEVIEKLVIL